MGYTGYFDNRSAGVGGGVAVYVRSDITRKSQQIPINIDNTEALCIDCQLYNNFSFIIYQIYKPPSIDTGCFIEGLANVLESQPFGNKTVFVCGDFNIDLLSINTKGSTLDFFNLLASSSLFPLISKPTRVQNASFSLIDNIFCNNLNIIQASGIILDDISDHFPIFININMEMTVHKAKEEKLAFDSHKIPELTSHLAHELSDLESITDPDKICDKIINAYISGISKYSYTYKPNRKNNPIKPWVSPAILKSIEMRCHLYRLKQSIPSQENVTKYNKYRNILNNVIRIAKKQYIQEQLKNNRHDSKQTWNILLSHVVGKVPKSSPSSCFLHDGNVIEEYSDIAEHFNSFFSSVGTKLQENLGTNIDIEYPLFPDLCIEATTHMQLTSGDELTCIIKSMKNVGSGYDQISLRY